MSRLTPSRREQIKGGRVFRMNEDQKLVHFHMQIPASVRDMLNDMTAEGNPLGWRTHRNAVESMIVYRYVHQRSNDKAAAEALAQGQIPKRRRPIERVKIPVVSAADPKVQLDLNMSLHIRDKLDVLCAPGNRYGWSSRSHAIKSMIVFRFRAYQKALKREQARLRQASTLQESPA